MQQLGDPGPVHGKLAVGAINSAMTGVFPAILQKLKAENEKLEIRIVAGLSSPALMAQVDAGILDAAVVMQPPGYEVTHLLVHHLYAESMALILPRDMPYTNLAQVVETGSYIAFDRATWVGRSIDEFLARNGIEVRPAMEFNAQDAILAVVRHGLGMSILPILRGSAHMRDPALQVIPIPGFQRSVALVERRIHAHSHLTHKLLSAFGALEANEGDATIFGR
jgi:DNA-binding transcriptional LysR family regulator